MTNKTKHDFTDVHNSFEQLKNALLLVAAKKGKGNEALVVIEVFNKEI